MGSTMDVRQLVPHYGRGGQFPRNLVNLSSKATTGIEPV
jgi:hypothetical protein